MGSSLVGYGLYIAAIAAIGILGSAYLFKSASDNLKDGFNTLKSEIESKIASSTHAAPSSPASPSSETVPPPVTPPAADNIPFEENTNPPI